MTIKPALYKTTAPIKAELRYLKGRFTVDIDGNGAVDYAMVNGVKVMPVKQGAIEISPDFKSGTIHIFTRKE